MRPTLAGVNMIRSVLVLSPFEYRADPQVSIHFVTRALADCVGRVSYIALPSRDRNVDEVERVAPARWQRTGAVRSLSDSVARPLPASQRWFGVTGSPPRAPLLWHEAARSARSADLILVEAGVAAELIPFLRRCAPRSTLVYFASRLPSAPQARRLSRVLAQTKPALDRVVVAARFMAPLFQSCGGQVVFMPPGVENDDAPINVPPVSFDDGRTVVAMAPEHLDCTTIQIAASAFPSTEFHLAGVSERKRYPPNVHDLGAASIWNMLPVVRRARVGLLAIRDVGGAEQLADASLEARYFEHHGIPVVCPEQAAGNRPLRIGYDPSRSASLRSALRTAFRLSKVAVRDPAPSWRDVVTDTFLSIQHVHETLSRGDAA